MRINVATPDYWPLPWYLREFNEVGYWLDLPEQLDADIIIAAEEYGPEIDDRLSGQYITEYYGLRHHALLRVYIEQSLWDRFIASRSEAVNAK